MASSDGKRGQEPAAARRSPGESRKVAVEDGDRRRPFMRGILVHSLMARGVSFDDAYSAANAVRARIGGREIVQKEEISKAIREVLGDGPFPEDRYFPGPIEISVTGHGKGKPFSKGVLSQSLLAAAIDPNDAFDVARQIERELVERDVSQIDRHELRVLAYEALARHSGEQTAARYLVWRKYQEPERPVMILLGGAAGVGKTSLALEVAHRLGIGRVLSTDAIRQIMRVMVPPELVPAIHGSSYDGAQLLPPEALAPDPVIEGFRAQVAAVSVGVRASMDRAVAENTSIVIDGVSLVPGLIDLAAYQGRADVIFLVVATLEEDSFRERFVSRAAGAHQRPEHRYLEHLDAILRIQHHVLELAEGADVPIVDNASLDRAVLLIIRHVTETLQSRPGFDAKELLVLARTREGGGREPG